MGYEAIFVVVERGKANDVVKQAAKAGARGATIFFGRGSGQHLFSFFRSLQIEPSKEIIIIVTEGDKVDPIFKAVAEAARVNETGPGIAFTIPISRMAGIDLSSNAKPE